MSSASSPSSTALSPGALELLGAATFHQTDALVYTALSGELPGLIQAAIGPDDLGAVCDDDLFAPDVATQLTRFKQRVLRDRRSGRFAHVVHTTDGPVELWVHAQPALDARGDICGLEGAMLTVDVSEIHARQDHLHGLLFALATRLAHAPGQDAERVMHDGLSALRGLIGADGAYLRMLGPSGAVTYAIDLHDDGSAPDVEMLPWLRDQVQAGQTVHIAEPSDWPPEAAQEAAAFRAQGLTTLLQVPLHGPKGPAGAVGVFFKRAMPEMDHDVRGALSMLAHAMATAWFGQKSNDHDVQDFATRLTQHLPDLVWVTEARTGRAVFTNQPREGFAGYAADALTGRSVADFVALVHPDERSTVEAVLSATELRRSDDVIRMEFRLAHHDGGWRWVEHRSAVLLRGADGSPTELLQMAVDITARKHTERSLERRLILERAVADLTASLFETESRELSGVIEQSLSRLAHATGAERIILAADLGAGMRFVGGGGAKPFKYPLGAAVPHALATWMMDSIADRRFTRLTDLSTAPEGMAQVFLERGVVELWRVPLRHGGRTVGLMSLGFAHPRPLGHDDLAMLRLAGDAVIGALMLQQRTAALDESLAFSNQVLETVPELVHILDLENGYVEFTNRAFGTLIGAGPEHLNTPHIDELAELLVVDDRKKWYAALEEAKTADAEAPVDIDVRLMHHDGTIRWAKCRYARFSARPGQTRLLGSMVDITTEKRAVEERLAVEAKLNQAKRLESLGVLAGGVAHDFNNLLVGVIGNVGTLMDARGLGDDERDAAEEIDRAARRAAELARQMLAYAGRARLEKGQFSLAGVLAEVVRRTRTRVPPGVAVRYAPSKSNAMVHGDEIQIRQVVTNLIINAIEAIEEGAGTVDVMLAERHVSAADLMATEASDVAKPGRYWIVTVTDTGVGMDATTRERMFEPFFTSKFTGRGLGLAAVLGIVRGHEGTLAIRSARGRGTSIELMIPMTTAQNHAAAGSPPMARSQPPGPAELAPLRVLAIEDEAMVRRILHRVLERDGHHVTLAEDGLDGVEQFTASPDAFDVVILDMTMPRMSGEQVLVELKKTRPDIQVIVSSGYAAEDATGRFDPGTIAGFLQKPWRPADLSAILATVVRPG